MNQWAGRRRKMIFANVREPMSTFDHQKEWNRERRLKSRRFLIRTTFISTYIDFSMFSLASHQPKNDKNARDKWEHQPVGCWTCTNSTDDPWPFEWSVGSFVSCLVTWSTDDSFSFFESSIRPADNPGIEIISHSWFSSSSFTIRDKMIWAEMIS